MRSDGDCPGHTIKEMAGSRKQCGRECDSMNYCKGYLYILSTGKKFSHPPCLLKRKMCKKRVYIDGLDISAYFKTRREGK